MYFWMTQARSVVFVWAVIEEREENSWIPRPRDRAEGFTIQRLLDPLMEVCGNFWVRCCRVLIAEVSISGVFGGAVVEGLGEGLGEWEGCRAITRGARV